MGFHPGPPQGGDVRLEERSRLVVTFLLVLLAARILFLLAGLEPAEERVMEVLDPAYRTWSHGPACPLYDREELYVGTAAEAICQGVHLPLAAYRFMPYGSAGLAAVLVTVPLYQAFGPHYLVLKILPLLVTMAGGLAWLLVVRAWFGARAARLFGLLYILAPPVLVRTALIEMGGHPEAMAWIGWVCNLATLARDAATPRARMRWGAAAGTLAGLGVWVTYSVVPVTAALALAGLAITRARPRAAWIAAAAGLVVGLVPWIIVVAGTGGAALEIYGRPLGALVDLPTLTGRVKDLCATGLMAGYDLPGGAGIRMVAGWIWLLAVALGWWRLLRSDRRSIAILLGAGTLAHVLAFLLVAPDSSSRYLVPVAPLFLIAAVHSMAPFRETLEIRASRVRPASRATFVCALALGLASQVAVVASSTFPVLRAPLKGTYWPLFGEVMGRKLTGEGILSTPPAMRPFLWVGYGEWTFFTVEPTGWQEAARVAGPDSARVWEGIGISWLATPAAARAGPFLRGLSDPDRLFLRRGFSYAAGGLLAAMASSAPGQIAPLLLTFDPVDRPALAAPLARIAGVFSTQEGSDISGSLEPVLSPVDRVRGMGWSLYRGSTPAGSLRMWKQPPTAAPVEFWQGVADAYEWELRTRDNDWILGDARGQGPLGLARDVERITRGLDHGRAVPFYAAAGRAAAIALREPSRRPVPASASWVWENAFPAPFRPDFARGLSEGVAGFGP